MVAEAPKDSYENKITAVYREESINLEKNSGSLMIVEPNHQP